jgi:hypothetical protein
MSAVDDAVKDRVGQGGIADHLVPAADRHLAGDQQRTAIAAVVDDLEQIAPLLALPRVIGGPLYPFIASVAVD